MEPHSRACEWGPHEHGPACHRTCPTCRGENHAVTEPDIVLPPHPHKLVCPTCGLTRYLPEGWQAMLKSETLTCTVDNRLMVELPQ